MGDFIEGPSTHSTIVYGTTSARSQEKVKKKALPSLFTIFLVCMLCVLVIVIVDIVEQASEGRKFSEAMTGRCFVTAVGARGMADSADLRTSSLKLIFPSGLRESYPVEGLDEIPCGLLAGARN